MEMKAVILSIGDELVLGQTTDTNSAWLSSQLAAEGVMTSYHQTVADQADDISKAITAAAGAADLLIITGGLGPTTDDLTREALAVALNQPLELHEASLDRIRLFFKSLGREMPDSNRVQAMVPRGAMPLSNDWGTAPGIEAVIGKCRLFVFPGVPHEMMQMFHRYVLPVIPKNTRRCILTETINTFGAGESIIAEKLGDLMQRDRTPLVGTTVSGGIVSIRIRSDFPSLDIARRELEATVDMVRARLDELVFGRGKDTLQEVVGTLARYRKKKLATAESCTGGLVARMLTDVAGSSDYFIGGWVVYSNDLKSGQLGVPAELITEFGAVSEQVASAMAVQALLKAGADMSVALTGIAGPGGGTPSKPVGTLWIGIAVRKNGNVSATAKRFLFPGDRATVRDRAAKTALNLLRLALVNG